MTAQGGGREEQFALLVPCPNCLAEKGEPCLGELHASRVALERALGVRDAIPYPTEEDVL